MEILFDADMLVFRMSAACQELNPFDKSIISKADPDETWRTIEMRIDQCIDIVSDHFEEDVGINLCFSSKRNFRKEVNPSYKANRTVPKPVLYYDMKSKCERLYKTTEWDGLEADDVMGILQNDNTIICSGDKDMKQIAGYHLNLIDPELGVEEITQKEGDQMFHYQCLSGDSTDGYYGCPGIGKKKAQLIVDQSSNWWQDVVSTYESAMSPKTKSVKTEGGAKRTIKLKSVNLGLGLDDALITARMAYILRNEDEYNHDTQEVKLWVP